MIIVNSDLEKFISGSYGGKNFSIPYLEELHKKLKKIEEDSNKAKDLDTFNQLLSEFSAIVEEFDYKKEVATNIGDMVYVPNTDKYHIRVGNGYSDVFLPENIVQLILDNSERSITNEPIVNLCRRFMLNPKPTQDRFEMLGNYITQKYTDFKEAERLEAEEGMSSNAAFKYATYSDLQITAEGYLKTSKVVKEITKKYAIKMVDGKPVRGGDGKFATELVDSYPVQPVVDEETGEVTEKVSYPEFLEDRKFTPAIWPNGDKFFSGDAMGYKYEIGKLAMLEHWDQVAMIDGQAHQKGLHTGGLSYIDGYLNVDRVLLDVFVCPSQIGKFCNNGLGEMTCKEMFVFGASTIEGTTHGLYHTDSYSKIQSKDLVDRLDEKAKEIEAARAESDKEVYDMAEIAKSLKL